MNNRLLDENIIEELTCGNNFAYVFQDESYLVMTDYKVLQSQTDEGFIRCTKMKYNGKMELFYRIDEYRTFASVIGNISSEMFLTIIKNLFTEIIKVRSNGFLSCQNIDISWNKIFVDTNTLKVKLVYIPSNKKIFEEYSAFENELRTGLIKLINSVPSISNDAKLVQLVVDLSNGTLTLEDLYNKTKGETISNVSMQLNGMQSFSGSTIKLVMVNVADHFEIVIDKDEVLIGKKVGTVDAVIPFSNMISRMHCKIFRRQNNYYICDVGSTNGTYVNRVRLAKNQSCEIRQGDLIRLANCEFQVV